MIFLNKIHFNVLLFNHFFLFKTLCRHPAYDVIQVQNYQNFLPLEMHRTPSDWTLALQPDGKWSSLSCLVISSVIPCSEYNIKSFCWYFLCPGLSPFTRWMGWVTVWTAAPSTRPAPLSKAWRPRASITSSILVNLLHDFL